MFITCFDNILRDKLIASGFKILNQKQGISIFVYDKKIKFDFSSERVDSFAFTNKLTF